MKTSRCVVKQLGVPREGRPGGAQAGPRALISFPPRPGSAGASCLGGHTPPCSTDSEVWATDQTGVSLKFLQEVKAAERVGLELS